MSPEHSTVPGRVAAPEVFGQQGNTEAQRGTALGPGHTGSTEVVLVPRPSAPSAHLLSPHFGHGIGSDLLARGYRGMGVSPEWQKKNPSPGAYVGEAASGVCTVSPSRSPRLPPCPLPISGPRHRTQNRTFVSFSSPDLWNGVSTWKLQLLQ